MGALRPCASTEYWREKSGKLFYTGNMNLNFRRIVIISLGLLAAILACNVPGTLPNRPVVEIQSPVSGTATPVNEPLVISSVATDPTGPGVSRIELFVDGASVLVDESPGEPLAIFDVAQEWVPSDEGQVTVTVIAYREDGTPSRPSTISVTVVGMSADAAQVPTATSSRVELFPESDGSESSAESPAATSSAVVQGKVLVNANIRSGPGPYCDIIGSVSREDVINLLETSKDQLWYKTDFLGSNRIGWIYVDPVEVIGDPADIPHGDRSGCRGCGDGVCYSDETCDSCPEDCGICCGNKACEPEYGEDCATCELDCGPCCGNGACEAGRGEDCGTCELDCGPCCGNGTCEAGRGENCATCSLDCGSCCGNGVCEAGRGENCATCSADCGNCCGNGLCESGQGENCATCPGDCGNCCGNGLCESARGETCSTCPSDCGVCPTCGDGTCDSTEDCTSCAADCGACAPVCGDGTCEPTEDCTSCAADCGACAPVCGDGTCDPTEDCTSCAADCGACP
jgi:hypothetical protein